MTVVPTPSHLPQPALSEDFQEQSYWAFRGSGGQGNVCWLVAGQAQLLSALDPLLSLRPCQMFWFMMVFSSQVYFSALFILT